MKQTLFRGMDVNGVWHLVLLAESAGFPGQPDEGDYISNTVGSPYAYQIRIDTIGQYIGVRDSHGTMLFEGDVVEYDYDDSNDPHGIGYPHAGKKERTVIEFTDLFDVPDVPNDFTIVGNVHELKTTDG